MADSNRIVFPDELENMKAENAKKNKKAAQQENQKAAQPELSEKSADNPAPERPPGYKMDSDGEYRPVFL